MYRCVVQDAVNLATLDTLHSNLLIQQLEEERVVMLELNLKTELLWDML